MDFLSKYLDINLEKNCYLTGLNDEIFSIILSNLFKKKNKNILVVTGSLSEANNIYIALKNYTSSVFLFPMDDFLTSEALAISPDLCLNRLSTINSIIDDKAIVITNLTGYLRFLPKLKTYKSFITELSAGDEINPKTLALKLTKMGYVKSTLVTSTGEMGLRGFVIDVFPIESDYPVRIEFFGDEIESIRYFDLSTQKSLPDKLDSIKIYPNCEFLTHDDVDDEQFNKQKYLQLYEDVSNVSEYLGEHYTFFKDYSQILNIEEKNLQDIKEYRKEKDNDFKLSYMYKIEDLEEHFPVFYNTIDVSDSKARIIDLRFKSVDLFYENIDYINQYIGKCLDNDKTVVVCLKEYQITNFKKSINFTSYVTDEDNIKVGKLNIINKSISSGFVIGNFVVISEKELFSKNTISKKYVSKYKYSTSVNSVFNLAVGDYVVHNVHGIGIYNGIKVLTLYGATKDYLEILYQGSDKIYIPVEKIELLHKYSPKDGSVPKINKLGSKEWEKTKKRVRQKVREMADELLHLYAIRQAQNGFAFSPDTEMLEEFQNEFEYTLTVDQERAIQQIKKDMESSVPMDRLLCGDVGFGKTEVAFVAAFKAILDSKQVLFLCPTTILSSQHYENAVKRFRNFPVNIALLNRFTSTAEKDRILSGLKSGIIDMVIGTHRLLSDDIELKDLGLLIVDEEQRFGVIHKEKLKKYKTNVDILTLSATPIPRTLQMSLSGIRGLSLIETPPVNRYPVQTYVIEENMQIIKSAIEKELARDGQVYILFNNVVSIEEECYKIQQLVPSARVTFAHGQMTKVQLENQIVSFINHEYDVLICTTIIETGIDIPNVNTLVVINADCFGLSQLYQLRGRVGRSNRFAYAYLMFNPKKVLSTSARKRLEVIKQFTKLGSGFSIATRDLSIRGAGDMFGSEQSGFIDSVGIDLYMQILNEELNHTKEDDEAVEEIKGVNVSTHISDSYVDDDELKIEIHRLINEIDSRDKLKSVYSEISDRFGTVSEDLNIYMYEELFENYVKKVGILSVIQGKNSIELRFTKEIKNLVNMDDLFIETYNISKMFRFMGRGECVSIVLDLPKLDKHPIYYLVDLLEKLLEMIKND